MDHPDKLPAPSPADTRPFWLVLTAVVACAVALRQVEVANTDVSWLLTVGEKVLGGQRLYRDVIETNPPIAMLAYLPGLLLGRALHIRAETMTDVMTFIWIALSVLLTLRITALSPAFTSLRGWPFMLFTIAVLAIMPMQTFGQREHLALLALLPSLAALLARARGEALPLRAVVTAGVAAAITLSFKPYFVLPIGAGIVAAAVMARSWRVLFAPEHWIAAVLIVAYGGITWLMFPDYFTVIYPLVRDVYIPLKRPLSELLASPGVAVWAAALVLAVALRPAGRTRTAIILLTVESLGFAVAYLLQRKGWAYQSTPMIALALIALGLSLASLPATTARLRAVGALVAAAVLFIGAAIWMNDTSDARALVAPVARLHPHPKVLALSGEASIGHPLTRLVGGSWVSGQQDLFVHEFVTRLRHEHALDAATDARLAAYEARERAMLLADIRRDPPDVLLVDNLLGQWGAWLSADPELSALLKPYHHADTVQNIEILARDP